MKTKIMAIVLGLMASIGTMSAWDYERVQIGDLYYNLDATSQTAEVTSQNGSSYPHWSTDITTANILASVTYIGTTYSVTSIGQSAFSGCTGLMSVTIPNSVTSIGRFAFYGCSSLMSVTIPNSVTSIGQSAFYGCTGLMSVTIPNSVTSIRDGAFSLVPNVIYTGTATGYPWGAKSVNGYVDGYFVYSDNSKTTLLACSSSAQGEVSVPNSVTNIGNNAFYGCNGLTSVTIPNSVNNIGSSAFQGCSGLTSVTIPNSVTSIGDYTFCNCSSLISVTIPNSVTSIGQSAFSGCTGLLSVTIPNSVTSIGQSAFYGCTGLMSVTIPNSVTSIRDGAFSLVPNVIYTGTATGYPWGAKSVNGYVDGYFVYSDNSKTTLLACSSSAQGEVSVPNSVTSIDQRAFYGCSSLTSVTIPNNVTSIEDYTFCNCSGLTSVTIPNSVTSIGSMAFDGCSSLTSVTIPNSVTSIGDYAFRSCRNITSVNFHEQITSVGRAPFYNSGIKYPIYNSQIFAHIPHSETGSYSIPEGITIIADKVFDQSQLSTLTIPSSVTLMPNIGGPCQIRTIVCKVVVPPQLKELFYSELVLKISGITVYVPDESVQAYKNAKIWELCNILPMSALPQSLENPSVTEEKSIKVMENGHIYIKRGDKTYTITGAEL